MTILPRLLLYFSLFDSFPPSQCAFWQKLKDYCRIFPQISNESIAKPSSRFVDSNGTHTTLCHHSAKGHFAASQYSWIFGKRKFIVFTSGKFIWTACSAHMQIISIPPIITIIIITTGGFAARWIRWLLVRDTFATHYFQWTIENSSLIRLEKNYFFYFSFFKPTPLKVQVLNFVNRQSDPYVEVCWWRTQTFYSCRLSILAFEWMWGWGWPCQCLVLIQTSFALLWKLPLRT